MAMKKWLLKRKTLKHLGFTSETASTIFKATNIDENLNVTFVNDNMSGLTFRGNISNDSSIDVTKTMDKLSATTGYINITNATGETAGISIASGATETFILLNEDGITVANADCTYVVSNSNAVCSSVGIITGVDIGICNISITLTADTDVVSIVKVTVTS